MIQLDADGWLHVIELVGGMGMGTKIVRILMDSRDALRDLKRDVGSPEPPTGLFRRVNLVERQAQQTHEDVLKLQSAK